MMNSTFKTVVVLTICFLFLDYTFLKSQEIPLKGIVTIHNSGYLNGQIKYVENAFIQAKAATPTSSDREGKFQLIFSASKEGQLTKVKVEKAGLEVVNQRELNNVVLGKESPLRVFLSPRGALAKAQIELYEVNIKALNDRYNNYISILENDLGAREKVLIELSSKLNKELSNTYEAEQALKEQIKKIKQELPVITKELVRVNLDFAEQYYRDAYAAFSAGDAEKTLSILAEVDLEKEWKEHQNQMNTLVESQAGYELAKENELERARQLIQSFTLKSQSHRLNFEFKQALEANDWAIKLYEETDLNSEIIELFKLHDLGFSMAMEYGDYEAALRYFDKKIKPVKDAYKSDPDQFSRGYAEIMISKLEPLLRLGRLNEAFEVGLFVSEELEKQNPPPLILELVYSQLSKVEFSRGFQESGLQYARNGLSFIKKHFPDSTSIMNQRSIDLSLLLLRQERNTEAEELILSTLERLENANPKNWNLIALCYSNLAGYEFSQFNFQKSEAYFQKVEDIIKDSSKLDFHPIQLLTLIDQKINISTGRSEREKTQAYLTEKLELINRYFSPSSVFSLSVKLSQGLNFFVLGQNENALKVLNEIKEPIEKKYSKDPELAGKLWGLYSEIYLQNREVELSTEYLNKAIEVYDLYNSKNPELAKLYLRKVTSLINSTGAVPVLEITELLKETEAILDQAESLPLSTLVSFNLDLVNNYIQISDFTNAKSTLDEVKTQFLSLPSKEMFALQYVSVCHSYYLAVVDYPQAKKEFFQGIALMDSLNIPNKKAYLGGLYMSLAQQYIFEGKIDSSYYFIEKGGKLIEGNNFPNPNFSMAHSINSGLASYYFLKNDMEKANFHYDQAIAKTKNLSNKTPLGQSYLGKAFICLRTGEDPMVYLDKAQEIFQEISQDHFVLTQVFSLRAQIESMQGNFEKSIKHNEESNRIYRLNKLVTPKLISNYLMQALAFVKLGDLEATKNALAQAKNSFLPNNPSFKKEIPTIYKGIGTVYFNLGILDSAKHYLLKSISQTEQGNLYFKTDLLRTKADLANLQANMMEKEAAVLQLDSIESAIFKIPDTEKSLIYPLYESLIKAFIAVNDQKRATLYSQKLKAAIDAGRHLENDQNYLLVLGQQQLNIGKPELGISYFKQVSSSRDKQLFFMANLLIGDAYMRLMDPENAFKYYNIPIENSVNKKNKNLVPAYRKLGEFAFVKNDFLASEQSFLTIIEILEEDQQNVYFADAHAFLGFIYAQNNLKDKAVNLFHKADLIYKRVAPNSPIRGKALIFDVNLSNLSIEPQKLMEKLTTGIEILTQYQTVFNYDLFLGYHLKGNLKQQLGKEDHAEKNWHLALDLLNGGLPESPQSSDLYFRLGYLESRKGNYAKAVEYLDEGLKIFSKFFPDNPMFGYHLGYLGVYALRIGDLNKARECFDQGEAYWGKWPSSNLQFKNTKVGFYINKGRTFRYLDDKEKYQQYYQKALEELLEVLPLDQRNTVNNTYYIGVCHYHLKDYEAATEWFVKSKNLGFQNEADYLEILFYSYLKMDKLDLASNQLEEMRKLNIKGGRIELCSAAFYVKSGDHKKALSSIEDAIAAGNGEYYWINSEETFTPLKSSQKFQELLNKIRP